MAIAGSMQIWPRDFEFPGCCYKWYHLLSWYSAHYVHIVFTSKDLTTSHVVKAQLLTKAFLRHELTPTHPTMTPLSEKSGIPFSNSLLAFFNL